MKLLIKYIWSLVLIPFLIFIKGDLSMGMLMQVNEFTPLSETHSQVMSQLQDKPSIPMVFEVKPKSSNPQFSADGMAVQLYDSSYTLLAESQIVNGKVLFKLTNVPATGSPVHVVVTSTQDELTTNVGSVEGVLEVHEEYLSETIQ